MFVSDGLVMDPGDHPSFLCRFEPTTLISVLSASTSRIGLGATVSTSFGEPYHVARTFASIDHISKGRAAWNVVTTSGGRAALNFSRERHMEHDHRYEVSISLRKRLEAAGLIVSGTSPDERLVEIIELSDHPFFVASQFHPEFKSRPTRPAPLFREFVQAALGRARERRGDRVELAR